MPMSEYMRRLRAAVGSSVLEVPSVGAIIRDAEGRILLVLHDEGVWTTPGGAVEPYEVPADAIVREVKEETGLDVEPTRILGVYGGPEFVVVYRGGDVTSYLMVYFECTVRGGEMEPDGDETHDVAFVAQGDLADLPTPDWLGGILADAFDPPSETRFALPGTPGVLRSP